MDSGAELVIIAGALVAANEALFAPIAGAGTKGSPAKDLNWRVVPATVILAALVAGLGKVNPQISKGIGILTIFTVVVAPLGNASSPIINLAKIGGFSK